MKGEILIPVKDSSEMPHSKYTNIAKGGRTAPIAAKNTLQIHHWKYV
jgi:hypothetical protein